MQTCIVKGFVDVPGTKYYYYHGMLRPCNIQPEIECFDKIDTTLSKWKLIMMIDLPLLIVGKEILIIFIPSFHTKAIFVTSNSPDHKRRYYFL